MNCVVYLDQSILLLPGAFAVYLEPWHADIFEFLDLRKNHGSVCPIVSLDTSEIYFYLSTLILLQNYLGLFKYLPIL